MPARFLTAEQRRCYGCFPDKLSADALARHFHLDATDRTIIQGLRGPQNRLGFAVQLGTVRLLGRFPDSFTDLPLGVIRATESQLGGDFSESARRLDSLGAITRGQRQTGGQGLFRADDNLEIPYARAALRQFYQLLYAGKIEGCSLGEFQEATGLDLTDQDGSLKEELPPITQFLNRILALRIAMQNTLFATFEQLLDARIEAAVAGGTYDIGVETLTAESFHVAERRTVCTYAATGSETRCYRVLRKNRNRPLPLAEALALRAQGGRLLINEQTRRTAVQMHAPSLMDDDGRVEIRTRLIRPMSRETLSVERFEHSHWRTATREQFSELWDTECAAIPEFTKSAFHIITGLLLPVWDRLPADNMRVYRFETDDGERVIDRLVTPEELDRVYCGLGLEGAPALSPGEAWNAVLDRGATLDLAGGMQIRRSLVMQAHRVELAGYADGVVPQLKALGLTPEIIAWRLRLFIPTAEDRGPAILAALLDRHPLLGAHARAAA